MARGWYILHTYSGYENKIEKTIRSLIDNGEISADIITDIKVPVEEVVEVKDGKKRSVTKKFLPGYILIEMELPELGWKATCSSIRKIQGVTGFVGTPGGVRPQPISAEEAKSILQKAGEIKGEKNRSGQAKFFGWRTGKDYRRSVRIVYRSYRRSESGEKQAPGYGWYFRPVNTG